MDEDKWIDAEWLCEQTNGQIEKAKWKGKADSEILIFIYLYWFYLSVYCFATHFTLQREFHLGTQRQVVLVCVTGAHACQLMCVYFWRNAHTCRYEIQFNNKIQQQQQQKQQKKTHTNNNNCSRTVCKWYGNAYNMIKCWETANRNVINGMKATVATPMEEREQQKKRKFFFLLQIRLKYTFKTNKLLSAFKLNSLEIIWWVWFNQLPQSIQREMNWCNWNPITCDYDWK